MISNSLKSIFLFNLVLCCSMCIHHINQNFEFFLWCPDVDFVRVEGYSRGFGVWGSSGLGSSLGGFVFGGSSGLVHYIYIIFLYFLEKSL